MRIRKKVQRELQEWMESEGLDELKVEYFKNTGMFKYTVVGNRKLLEWTNDPKGYLKSDPKDLINSPVPDNLTNLKEKI